MWIKPTDITRLSSSREAVHMETLWRFKTYKWKLLLLLFYLGIVAFSTNRWSYIKYNYFLIKLNAILMLEIMPSVCFLSETAFYIIAVNKIYNAFINLYLVRTMTLSYSDLFFWKWWISFVIKLSEEFTNQQLNYHF